VSSPQHPVDQVDQVDQALHRLPHLGDNATQPVALAEMYAELADVARRRAAYYGKLLADQIAAEGVQGLIGAKVDGTVVGGGRDGVAALELYQTSEEIRGLVVLEAQERDRAERLAREAIKLGVEASKTDVMRSYGQAVARSLQSLIVELGLNWADPATRRAAQRAVLRARQSLGFDHRAPESIGPALTREERDRVLGRAPTPLDDAADAEVVDLGGSETEIGQEGDVGD
jgi:hypothetical protein